MSLPSGFLEELRARAGLADIVGRRVRLIRRGREWTGLCPFHAEKTPSFTVNEAKGFYHCFGCGAHGSAIDFVMNTEGLSFPEAVERLAAQAGMEMPRQDPAERARQDRRGRLLEAVEAAAAWFQAQLAGSRGREARGYLAGRGVTEDQAGRFRLGYAPPGRDDLKQAMLARGFDAALQLEAGLLVRVEEGGEPVDRFRHRLIFPIEDRAGRVIAFGGRALGEARAKYLNSPETPLFHKGHNLYNLPRARQAAHDRGRVVVVEGYMDVVALDRAGIAECVAPLGTALGEAQMRLLWRLGPEPVLCFDGDDAGQRAAARAAERALPLLQGGHSFRFALLPAGHDPDSLVGEAGAAALEQVLAGAVPLVELLWRRESGAARLDTPERWADLRQRLQRLADGIGDRALRRYYMDDFGRRLTELRAGEAAPSSRRRAAGRGGRRWSARPDPARAPASLASGLGIPGARRERMLLALLLSHPGLIDEAFEDLAGLRCESPALDSLRCAILESAHGEKGLDVGALQSRFTGTAVAGLLAQLSNAHAEGLTFVRPDAPLTDARAEWRSVLHVHRLEHLRVDVDVARTALAEDTTPANQARLMAAKQALEAASRETPAGGPAPFGGPPPAPVP